MVEGQSNCSIWITHGQCMGSNPIEIANRIAVIIDQTKGGEYVYLASTEDVSDPDYAMQLREELDYLDVEGKTMKSRLMVDYFDEDFVEETMSSGVNKFVTSSH